MFETKKSATKKMLKEIEAAFKGDIMIAQKRKLLQSVEEMATATRDQGLYQFWFDQSQLVNAQEAALQGRPYTIIKEVVFVP